MPKIKKTVASLLISFVALASLHAAAETKAAPTITSANAEFVYKYLLGEVAMQRGEPILASQLFLDLAKQTLDPRLAQDYL